MALQIGQHGNVPRTLHCDVLRTSYFNVLRTAVEHVLRTSVGDNPWRCIEDLMGTTSGRSSGRPRDLIHLLKVMEDFFDLLTHKPFLSRLEDIARYAT